MNEEGRADKCNLEIYRSRGNYDLLLVVQLMGGGIVEERRKYDGKGP